jgi:hypothetical protein
VSTDFEKLCDLLDDEIERQQNVNAVCLAHHEALCARDAVAIDARNEALELLARESDEEAVARDAIVARISRRLGVAAETPRLRELADRSPEPWKSKLIERRETLREVAQSNQRLVRRNELIARRSKNLAESWQAALFQRLGEIGPGYRGDGHVPQQSFRAAAMIDQRG